MIEAKFQSSLKPFQGRIVAGTRFNTALESADDN
jgi:hypothetical protein